MRRNVGRQPHRDAARAVDEQVGKTPRQGGGFHQTVVEIQGEIHRFLVDIAQEFQREFFQPRLGIAVCRRAVAVHRTEVAVPVDEGHAHVEILRHPHERVIDGSIAVRVVFTEAVPHDLSALSVRFIGGQPHFVHGV